MLWRVVLLLIFEASALVSGMFLETNKTLEMFLETSSLLEVASSGTKLDRCESFGDTHVTSFRQRTHFNVMGEEEWVIAEGPTHRTIAKWVVQGTQRKWNDNSLDDTVTVLKNIGLRCGNFFALVALPPQGHASPRTQAIVGHGLYVKGSNRDSGREYTATNCMEDPDFATGQTVRFDDGAGQIGRLVVVKNDCTAGSCACPLTNGRRSACKLQGVIRVYEFQCQGTVTRISNIQGDHGGNFVNITLDVPVDNPSANIRVGDHNGVQGNLAGGYCGGWDSATSQRIKTEWDTCRRTSPQGFRPSNLNTLAYCRTSFVTTPQNSIFSAFETWTGIQLSSKFDSKDAAVAATDITKMSGYAQLRDACIAMARKVAPEIPFKETPTNPKEANIHSQVLDCAEDTFHNLQWTDDMMKTQICQINAFKISQERKDIFCAARALYNQGEKIDPDLAIVPSLQRLKTPADILAFETLTSTIPTHINEVQQSTLGIAYWNTPLCESFINDDTNIASTNCEGWNFQDTMTEMKKGFGNAQDRILSSAIYGVRESGSLLEIDNSFDNPVLFLGAPTYSDQSPVVPRFSKLSANQYQVFLATNRCQNQRSHGGETMSHLVLDNNFDYGPNVRVIQASVDGTWKTIQFGKNMGDASAIRVFTTVQTSNNGACYNCNSISSMNGYVSVRVRSISSTSAEFRIQGDRNQNSITSETIAILIINSSSGTIAGQNFITRSVQTAQTSVGTNGVPTNRFDINLGSSFKSVPVQLYQIVDDSDSVAAHVRIASYGNPTSVIAIDRDTCSSRAHPRVVLHILAVDSTGPW